MISNTPQIALDRIEECKRTKSTHLDLSGLGLTKIPVEISELIWLKILRLGGNQLAKIEGLEHLRRLSELSLDDNHLSKIEGLENLSNLSELWLSNNQLTKIEGLEKLSNLSSLWLNNNQLEDLTPFLPFIKKGINVLYREWENEDENGIYLNNNPLQIPDIETVMRGNDAILAYFQEREEKEKYEAKSNDNSKELTIAKVDNSTTPSVKMILFGNSNAGKTNLSKYLREGIFDKNDRDSTHGILIENWQPEGENLMAHIWDFGGQEYYHGAYRLFMTNKTVFVVAWEQETNQNFGNKHTLTKNKKEGEADDKYEELVHFELHYWLDSIRHYAPNSPILLLQNKVDEAKDKQRHSPDLFADYGITDDFSISLLLGSDPKNVKQFRDIQHFKQELITILAENTYKSDDILSRLKLRDELIDLQEENTVIDNPFLLLKDELSISVFDFEIIMKTVVADIVLTNTIDVLDWLHTRGIVLFYKDNTALNDKVFLQPKRVIDAIYGILDKEILKKEGQFSKSDLQKKGEIDSKTALNLMLQMELIFKVPNAENQYIAPQYLPETHALQDLYEIASEEIQQLSYSVKLPLFYYRRVLQQLILHYGKNQDADCKAYFWKHGILIKKDGIRLLIKGLYPNENESEGIISIATDKKNGFMDLQKEVFRAIKNILQGREPIRAKLDERNDEAHHSSEKTNEKELEVNQKIEVSSNGIHFVSYLNLLEQAEKDERKILAFNKNKITKSLIINDFEAMLDKVPERPLKVFISYAHKDGEYLEMLQAHLRNLSRNGIIETWDDRSVIAGQVWDDKILGELAAADVVIMLMSAYFVDSDYIWKEEIEKAREGDKKKLILPIYVKAFDFHNLIWNPKVKEVVEGKEVYDNSPQSFNISSVQWLPFNNQGKLQAVSTWADRDEAMSIVARKIREAIENFKGVK